MKLKAIGMVNATLLAVLLVSSTAQAGSYHVYSCRTPGGEAAPADGWTGSVAPGCAYDDSPRHVRIAAGRWPQH